MSWKTTYKQLISKIATMTAGLKLPSEMPNAAALESEKACFLHSFNTAVATHLCATRSTRALHSRLSEYAARRTLS